MGQLHPELERILITTEEIQARVFELSKQITADFSDADQVYIVGILKGAFIFMADLTRQLHVDHTVDFMALSSYGKTTTTGAVRILMDLREPIDGKHVLIKLKCFKPHIEQGAYPIPFYRRFQISGSKRR